VIGEALYNLRSALDHVVWPLRARAFPIYIEAAEFWKEAANGRPHHSSGYAKIIKVGDEKARELIVGLQPFNRVGGDPETHPLWLLNQLRNIDEHRHLHVVAAASLGSYALPPPPDVGTRATWQFHRGRLHDGALIASALFDKPQTTVEVDLPFAFSIAFNEPEVPAAESVDDMLGSALMVVGQVVNLLAKFY
jgi:hypothetical protein